MEKRKIAITVGSIVCSSIFIFLVVCMGLFWHNRGKENIAYEDGYNAAFADKEAYDELMAGYRAEIDSNTANIALLNLEIATLTASNSSYETQIDTLTEIKEQHEATISLLELNIEQTDGVISSLDAQILDLESQIALLSETADDNSAELLLLTAQLSSLQAMLTQMQASNALNLATIATLNSQIVGLSNQIDLLLLELENNDTSVSVLLAQITALEESVAYYEDYIALLENGDQVIATFEFNGSVCALKLVFKGSTTSFTDPIGSDYFVFNGWTVNGVAVDLATYEITESTRFVASVIEKCSVSFYDGEQLLERDFVVKNGYATLPVPPEKEGYEFLGWSLNGIDLVDITESAVTQNINYYSVYAEIHTVTYFYENETVGNEPVRNGLHATGISVNSTAYKVFNGWTVNGVAVDLETYEILGSVDFVADITYKYDVIFKVDNAVYSSQIVVKNAYATLPVAPEKEGYEFLGWSLNGIDIVENIGSVGVSVNTIYIALFSEMKSLADCSWTEIAEVSERGSASLWFSVGETKDLEFSTSEVVTVVVMGFAHDNLSDGSGKAGITFGLQGLLSTTSVMNSTDTTVGGWASSEMRNIILPSIFSTLPAELKSSIKDVDKETREDFETPDVSITVDKLFLFSDREVRGSVEAHPIYSSSEYAEGSEYAYWSTLDSLTSFGGWNKRISGAAKDISWWFRSVHSSTAFVCRYSQSFPPQVFTSAKPATSLFGICFGFCI